MKNYQTRPTGSEPFPEVNDTRHGRGRNPNNYGYHSDHNSSNFKKIKNNEKYGKGKDLQNKTFKIQN